MLPASYNNGAGTRAGRLIINADDWGCNFETTQRIRECTAHGTVSSVSAMVFMEDSARAAEVAKEQGIDAGLHLNLTTNFTSANCPAGLADQQQQLVRYLKGNRFARTVFNPLLRDQFDYAVAAQIDEYRKLYGAEPDRIDGHHHMHLCANVLLGRLLPSGTLVRRNFSFQPGEKSLANRLYRKAVDHRLARRHRIVDFLFSLPPLDPPSRLKRIFSLANQFTVEVETHPVSSEEYSFLMGEELLRLTASTRIAPRFAIPEKGCGRRIDARRS
ncbi:MAG TPA: ChbG/HpnK family deacetylase [Candidatus Dormibacteraeota bacterium]|nr:ChbG/HpnK family deacetylase [Candidatus Dormibacteraeota bacterium]